MSSGGAASSPMRTVILAGPTATGKSSLAQRFAEERGGVELVSADSVAVFRHLDIGTAKPSAADRARVPHHLVDVRDPDEGFTAGDFAREAGAALEDIGRRGKRALVVGGTGFYLKALVHGLWDAPPAEPGLRARLEARPLAALADELRARDPDAASRIGSADRYRLVRALEILETTGALPSGLEAGPPDPRFELWVIDRDDAELEERIRARAGAMLEAGLLEEARRALERWPDARALGAVGYAECVRHLRGEPPPGRRVRPGLDGLRDEIALATRQLVKKQRTWFRSQAVARRLVLDRDLGAALAALREAYA
jgi:tRNA dimethylallyltransferase